MYVVMHANMSMWHAVIIKKSVILHFVCNFKYILWLCFKVLILVVIKSILAAF